jgi:hypothetical protein
MIRLLSLLVGLLSLFLLIELMLPLLDRIQYLADALLIIQPAREIEDISSCQSHIEAVPIMIIPSAYPDIFHIAIFIDLSLGILPEYLIDEFLLSVQRQMPCIRAHILFDKSREGLSIAEPELLLIALSIQRGIFPHSLIWSELLMSPADISDMLFPMASLIPEPE